MASVTITEDPDTLPPPGIDVWLEKDGANYTMPSEAVIERAAEGLDLGAEWRKLGAT